MARVGGDSAIPNQLWRKPSPLGSIPRPRKIPISQQLSESPEEDKTMNIVASGKQNQMVALNLHAPNRLVASVARYAWTRPWMTRGPWFPCRWYIELSAIMTSNVPSRQLPISILSGVFPPMLDTHHVLTRPSAQIPRSKTRAVRPSYCRVGR